MPRNEFLDHDDDFDLEVVRDEDGNPIEIIKVPKNHPGKGEHEDLSQEVHPIEEDPQKEGNSRPTLADLRKEPGFSTTQAHIAELYGNEDTPLS